MVTVSDPRQGKLKLWLYDLNRGTSSPFTFGEVNDQFRLILSGSRVALQAFQIRAQFRGALIADFAVLLQSLVGDAFEFRRKFGIEAERWCGRVIEDGIEQSGGGVTAKRKRARCHLVEDGAQ